MLSELLDDRLVMVTGKGGTGKSTVALATAKVLAANGRRTLLCEVDAQRASVGPLVGVTAGIDPVAIGPNLDLCNLLWPEVLAVYLQSMVRIKRVVNAILASDRVRSFLDFTPGSQELVELSVIGDLVERYDVVVVDMPASGHAFSMLDITRSAMGLFRGGPIRTRVVELRKLLHDARTRMLLVALPEEMVVNETLETLGKLRDGELLGGAPKVVLNNATPASFGDDERTLLQRVSALPLSPEAKEFAAAGRWAVGREVAVEEAERRLIDALVPPVLIPPAGTRDAGQVVDHVVATLTAAMEA